jgi:hypothetical protein
MSLATSFLTLEEIQLLADCIEPVLVLEIPAAAETLIHRGLLVMSEISRDPLPCHVLAVTERGRLYVTAWVERQERSQAQTGKALRPPLEFRAMGSS